MSNIIELKIGKFMIRDDGTDLGLSVFVEHDGGLVFCDNFDKNLHAAKEYIKRNSKGKIKIVDGEFYSK